jgi:hypothetical protein
VSRGVCAFVCFYAPAAFCAKGSIGRGADQLSALIASLGWSRAAYVEFCADERLEILIGLSRERLRGPRRGPARGALRQRQDGVVLGRNAYGRGAHRFHPGFLDYARHAGSAAMPSLSGLNQGQSRTLHPLPQGQLLVPFATSMKQVGFRTDKYAVNAAVGRWLREVADARVHATTKEATAERLVIEGKHLQRLSPSYIGSSACSLTCLAPRKAVIGYSDCVLAVQVANGHLRKQECHSPAVHALWYNGRSILEAHFGERAPRSQARLEPGGSKRSRADPDCWP